MQSSDNLAYVASAGAGKTSHIVDDALTRTGRVLITTYTDENVEQVRQCFIERCGLVPENVTVLSWYRFLLQDGVRPYQNQMGSFPRVRSISFKPLFRYHRKDDYFTKGGDIHLDKVAEFVFECNKRSGGLVVERLRRMYARIYIDELQDMAGYDLEFVQAILRNGSALTVVGDPRQATFSTNNAGKNRQFRRGNIYVWLKTMEKAGLLRVEEKAESHRCNQKICDFANSLFPELPQTVSKSTATTLHDGIFQITPCELPAYLKEHQPVCLRYSRTSNTHGVEAVNIGIVKGRTFNRVVIFPTKPMLKYLSQLDPSKVDRAKLYVAVTRARHSVAFVVDA